jgi:HNH endonuclease
VSIITGRNQEVVSVEIHDRPWPRSGGDQTGVEYRRCSHYQRTGYRHASRAAASKKAEHSMPQLSLNTTKLMPVNACIYCDRTESQTKLTDEHIIPLSLGGAYVLPKASCLKCAKLINNLEGYAGRHVFQDIRIEYGFPTRRPKERPTHLPLRESFSPSPETAPIRLVPTKDYPGALILITPEPAGILLGHPPEKKVTGGNIFVRQITGRERVDRLSRRGISAKIYREFQPDLILRLIAKIALGFAVAGYGLSGFDATVRDAILRRDTNAHYWVGGTTQDMDQFPPPSTPMVLHRVVSYMREIEGVPYLLIQLQLFAFLNTPIYTVVVGKLTETGLKHFKA